MTDDFAAAVTVSIPIFALAAGAEARSIRDRLQRPDPGWERDFAQYSAENELDVSSAAQVFSYFRNVPRLSRLHTFERVLALAGAIVWLVVFVLLTVAELLSLVWLADGSPPGHSGLAAFGLWSIAVAMVTLIAAPALYLAVPLLLPLDLIPAGLTKSVLPKVASSEGRGFVRRLLGELEGAIDRAGDAAEAEAQAKAKARSSRPRQELRPRQRRSQPPASRCRARERPRGLRAAWSGGLSGATRPAAAAGTPRASAQEPGQQLGGRRAARERGAAALGDRVGSAASAGHPGEHGRDRGLRRHRDPVRDGDDDPGPAA